ncbi:hypothetical protein QOL99_01475 [Deinococcus sp. MIMF12]|uniref:DUF1700 domain-containing protein n=1 Tax=Deinococcus rhizophilus TaxID=3049544 RepID=A0ABT7JCP0_9DEIO|nr:hypothetical protein [Deinococcus rhizophilus]MDL2342811.1 hypothetical protein [Deinococcus rhizophilus]
MTLDEWLAAATAGLPPEVAQRVRAEYAAHIQDSGQPEAEAVAALGEPERVRRALGRTYLSAARLETLADEPLRRGVLVFVWAMPLLYGVFTAWNFADAAPFPLWRLVGPGLTLLLNALVWLVTAHLPDERRRLWRGVWAGWSIGFMLWMGNALQLWWGADLPLPWFVPLWGLLLFGGLLWTAWEDRRLRRTLALKELRP